jgi:hypothetical protein
MTRLSHLRSKPFAHKLTSSISDNFEWSDKVDVLLTQARLGYETMLSQTNGERVDQRRSASRWQVIYRQWVVAPAAVVLVLDINPNRQYHQKLLQQINQVINHTIISCEQLWLECIILYPDQWEMQEYVCEWLEKTIVFLNTIIGGVWKTNALLAASLQQCYNEHYDKHIIILSDRLNWDIKQDANQMQHLLDTHQMIWYIRDYPSPIVRRWAMPQWLLWLK